MIDNSIFNESLPFSEYINRCRAIIESKRTATSVDSQLASLALEANAPFELIPTPPLPEGERYKSGALLVHGLFDCPFSLKDVGLQLQSNGILSRTILLPGHGTIPEDLLEISFEDWLSAVHYGIESFKDKVEKIYLIGYSTGAALSIYHALNHPQIAGIILLAPAIKIKAPVDTVVSWHELSDFIRKHKPWIYHKKEVDYSKYSSISFNAVNQVAALTSVIRNLSKTKELPCPMLMIATQEDETISTLAAIRYFIKTENSANRFILYSGSNEKFKDPRIIKRTGYYPQLNIKHLSHIGLPFSPENPHYGQNGDYNLASRSDTKQMIFGAYNPLEVGIYQFMFKVGLAKKIRRALTYNPDFNFMLEQMVGFMLFR